MTDPASDKMLLLEQGGDLARPTFLHPENAKPTRWLTQDNTSVSAKTTHQPQHTQGQGPGPGPMTQKHNLKSVTRCSAGRTRSLMQEDTSLWDKTVSGGERPARGWLWLGGETVKPSAEVLSQSHSQT
jgi:hypothetical protein